MLSFIIGTLITLVYLVKMLFSDITGNASVTDSIKEGIRNAKEIHDIFDEEVEPQPRKK